MLDFLWEDDDVGNENEICSFLRAKSTADVDKDQLQWWPVNLKRFPTIAKLGQSVLLAQATSLSSEGLTSMVRNLISTYC